MTPVDGGYVFDKAKYHDGSIEKMGLADEQSFVHTGLFIAWLVNNDLMSDFFNEESGPDILDLKHKIVSPSELYMNWDGVFVGDMLNETGFNFAMSYFDFDKGRYLRDYEKVFDVKGEDVFKVADTWDNYDKLRPAIDLAFKKWRS